MFVKYESYAQTFSYVFHCRHLDITVQLDTEMGNGLLHSLLDHYVSGNWPFSPSVDEIVQIIVNVVTTGKK